MLLTTINVYFSRVDVLQHAKIAPQRRTTKKRPAASCSMHTLQHKAIEQSSKIRSLRERERAVDEDRAMSVRMNSNISKLRAPRTRHGLIFKMSSYSHSRGRITRNGFPFPFNFYHYPMTVPEDNPGKLDGECPGKRKLPKVGLGLFKI